MHRIVDTIAQYDIGLFLLSPANFNYYHALPNKLFEFVQARLAVAIGPSPEMARIVNDHDLGIVAPDFEPTTMAAHLNALTPSASITTKASPTAMPARYLRDGNHENLDEIIGSLVVRR